jgi:poly(3-hydroxybutyrate) depolymerase
MFAALTLALLLDPVQSVQITSGYVIGGVSRAGRRPTPDDAIVNEIVSGLFTFPKVGEEVRFHGSERKWRPIHAGKDGSFDDPALENGYLAVEVDAPTDEVSILNAKGDSLVYVNGAPRAGDPYSNGYLNLPVQLHKGANQLLFVAGRGRLSATLRLPQKPFSLQSEDPTLPDVLTSDHEPLYASVVAVNATSQFTRGLAVKATCSDGGSITTMSDSIPPYSARKLIFKIPTSIQAEAGKETVDVELMSAGTELDRVNFPLQIKTPLQLQKRTFVSGIDGSVQYYAVWPASQPSAANALVLTLHGAGVEGYGQAAAYAQKSWATIVAPTNRRPYGFDWEGVGRRDALEVLAIAKRKYPHDPERVDLTGHSMGGHGTWSVGTLYPNLFASISPSAGWISFWSYAGGWNPSSQSPPLAILRRSMDVGDTLGRLSNTLSESVYILHGDADDNVPVQQARQMKAALEAIHHPSFGYHEQPGANHWWGNQCVDWPPIFETIQKSVLDPTADHVDFTTQSPSVSATDRWITIEQQVECLAPSEVIGDRDGNGEVRLTTTNVAELNVADLPVFASLIIDGQSFKPTTRQADFRKVNGQWASSHVQIDEKGTERGSGFKQIYNHRFAFIVGTHGDPQENRWALSRAIFNADTMMYRGNGTVDLVLDRDFSSRNFKERNLILFGNSRTNSAWPSLLGDCPPQSQATGSEGGLLIYPKPGETDTMVGAIGGGDLEGMKRTDRLAFFTSGVNYPDWILFDGKSPDGVAAAGFFDNQWRFDPAQSGRAGDR